MTGLDTAQAAGVEEGSCVVSVFLPFSTHPTKILCCVQMIFVEARALISVVSGIPTQVSALEG